jgi:hypothetical protein
MTRRTTGLAVAALLANVLVASAQQRGDAPNPLAAVKGLKCTFLTSVSTKWQDGVPLAQIRKAGALLTLTIQDIDPAEGSATIVGANGESFVTVKLTGANLHFIDMRPSGAVTLTTVFSQESKDKKLKAVHTRTDFLQMNLPGFVSEPEVAQYYGDCDIVP